MEKKIKPFVGAKVRIKWDNAYYVVTEVRDETFLAKWGDSLGIDDEHPEEYSHNLFIEYDEELVLTPEMVFKTLKKHL